MAEQTDWEKETSHARAAAVLHKTGALIRCNYADKRRWSLVHKYVRRAIVDLHDLMDQLTITAA